MVVVKQGFIYVHGANGSGKSTLARSLITCAGGISREIPINGKACISVTDRQLAFVGRYRAATGGADGVQPYALVPVAVWTALKEAYSVFAEGLMTPGIETCRQMDRYCQAATGKRAIFIWLDVPIEVCTRNVIARRTRKGNEKPYSNHHLIKKWHSSHSWANNLRAAGLVCLGLNWRQARDYCLKYFGLDADGAVDLLD